MNSHSRNLAAVPDAPAIGVPMPDGALLITAEQLARLGNGDYKRGRRELRLLLESERDPPVFNGPTEKPSTVRIAVPKDEKDILELMLEDLRENAEHIAPIHEDRIMEHIRSATEKRGAIIGLIDGPRGKPVAVCMLLPCQWWFSKAYFISEALNYVHPDHRKTKHIHDLIQFERWVGDQWSKNAGFRIWVLFSVLGGKRVREKVILYKRKLFESGRFFFYPSPTQGGD